MILSLYKTHSLGSDDAARKWNIKCVTVTTSKVAENHTGLLKLHLFTRKFSPMNFASVYFDLIFQGLKFLIDEKSETTSERF